MKSDVPILYENKENCCGCTACFAICPVEAITMISDEEGFLYPKINKDICIKCYNCIKVCRFQKDQMNKGYLCLGGSA